MANFFTENFLREIFTENNENMKLPESACKYAAYGCQGIFLKKCHQKILSGGTLPYNG